MQIVRSMYPLKSETWITKHHNDTFATWLQKEVMANDEIHEQLAWLARARQIQSRCTKDMKLMVTHFIQEPKITKAPIKIVVSV